MPRIRYLKPEFFLDEDLAALPVEMRLFYAGLWCHADREGRLEDRSRLLKAVIFPYDNNFDIEEMLEVLAKPKPCGDPYILRYAIRGKKYIQIVKFTEHQKPHHTEKRSKIPSPILLNGEGTVNEPSLNGKSQEGKNKNKNKKKNKKKRNGECEGKGDAAPAGVGGAPPAPIPTKHNPRALITEEETEKFREMLNKRRAELNLPNEEEL